MSTGLTVSEALSDVRANFAQYWPMLLGNILEWYEFGVFGYVETHITKNFFANSYPAAAWLVFSAGFAMRPFGGAIAGYIGDRFGRRAAMNFSIWGMVAATVLQAALPTHSMAGVVGLVFLRLMQGLCVGGEVGASVVYNMEVAPKRSLGTCAGALETTSLLGFLSASCVVLLLTEVLGQAAMSSYGWRIPFALALFPGVAVAWARDAMPESAMFEETVKSEEEESKFSALLNSSGPNLFIATLTISACAVQCYCGIWMNSYLIERGLPENQAMFASCVRLVASLCTAIPFGFLADHVGLGTVQLCSSCAVALLGFPLFAICSAPGPDLLVVTTTFGVVWGLMGSFIASTTGPVIAEMFPTGVRTTGVGLSYNIGFSIFGGLAPVVSEASLRFHRLGPGLIVSSVAFVSAASYVAALWMRSRGLVRLSHVRHEPYLMVPFGSFLEEEKVPSELASTLVHDKEAAYGSQKTA